MLYIYYYNFRAQLISEAIIEMDCNMEDLVMVNVAADIEEVRDVILPLMPRLHTALVKRERNTNVWTTWTKKQQKSGSTRVWPIVLVN